MGGAGRSAGSPGPEVQQAVCLDLPGSVVRNFVWTLGSISGNICSLVYYPRAKPQFPTVPILEELGENIYLLFLKKTRELAGSQQHYAGGKRQFGLGGSVSMMRSDTRLKRQRMTVPRVRGRGGHNSQEGGDILVV